MAVYAGQYGPEGVEYPNGQHASNTLYTVRTTGGTIATLYTDRDKVVTAPNPRYTDEFGNMVFFAEPGSYRLELGGMNFDVVVPLDPAETGDFGGIEDTLQEHNDRLIILESGGQSPVGIQAMIDDTIGVHVNDTTPHPAYDDMPSLVLLFENGLV